MGGIVATASHGVAAGARISREVRRDPPGSPAGMRNPKEVSVQAVAPSLLAGAARRLAVRALPVGVLLLAACASQEPTSPALSAHRTRGQMDTLVAQIRHLADSIGIGPLARPPRIRPALVRLGQVLAFDKILSGNRDIACMTCHLPRFETGDGRSLPIGTGGSGLGPDRRDGAGVVIPRNSPAVFNILAMQTSFWDGRVERDAGGRFHTPAGAQLTPAMSRVLEFGPISAQPLFPVLSREEMRGASGNELAAIPDDDMQGIWRAAMRRLGAIPEYRELFRAAYPRTRFGDMNFAYASNAIAAFLVDQLYFANSPWDRFLAGDERALSDSQLMGAKTFLSLKCVRCHNGPAFTDNEFHNVAIAQVGPGKGNGPSGRDDFGRFNVTGAALDRYAFRTTPLRNVELTGPYGHDGAFVRLRDFIDHYSQSADKLVNYDPSQLIPSLQGTLLANAAEILATRDTIITAVVFPASVTDDLTVFMSALTDPAARSLSRLVPGRVPSGLPIDH